MVLWGGNKHTAVRHEGIRQGSLLETTNNAVSLKSAHVEPEHRQREYQRAGVRSQTQPVGLGRPPYLVIGFIGPVIHILNMAFWSAPRYLANLRIGGTTLLFS